MTTSYKPVEMLLLLVAISLLVTLPANLEAVVVFAQNPDDLSEIEHQVTYEQALVEARNLKLYPGPIPGCKACTSAEMTYCQGDGVLEDHCCCDGGYNEVFGFAEHVCRVDPEPCKVRAGDCAEYSRLRECCCHSYLASLWKYLAGGAACTSASTVLIISLIVFLIFESYR